jgi:hypothetical protein
MSPFRWDVVGVGFVLALPLLALYLRGDLTVEEMTVRLPWCLVGGYVVVAVLRFAAMPRGQQPTTAAQSEHADPAHEPTPTA